jgi:peptidyl-prolyl cis-trans isomerase C
MNDKIIAKVGTLTVSESEIDAFLMELGQRGQSYNNPEGRRAILEQVIANKLFLLDAKRNLMEGEPAFKEQLNMIKEKLLIHYASEKALSLVTVSDAEAKTYYDENSEQFVSGPTVNASHILVDSEEKANDLLSKIRAGEISFEDAAKQNSSCPSGQNGGNLGDFGQGQMVPEFDTAVFSMEVGAISDAPVKTQFGYHLIKLNSKNEPKTMEFEEIKDKIKAMLLNDKKSKAYESKVNQLKIMYPVDIL